MIFSRIVCTVVLLVGSLARADTEYASRPEVQTFVGELVTAEGFSRAELLDVFREAKFQQSIVDAISKPAEKVLTWKEYQDIFLTEKRVEEGARFMSEHGATLARAEQAFGVPAAIVAAIIGVETMYGRYRGNYRVIDALSTLAFDYPPRAKFFRGELKQFLLLAREEKQSATEAKGSYAGAMGYGQFIPSSYRAYAIDFDGDGLRDIWQNPTDAIGSVANYLAKHGWVEGGSIVIRATTPGKAESQFGTDLKPALLYGDLRRLGLAAGGELPDKTTLAAIRLEGKEGSEFWLGLQNFYTITRYNHSALYAMAVFQLSQRLEARSQETTR